MTRLEEPFVSAYRWHVPDPVPFRKSIRFLIAFGPEPRASVLTPALRLTARPRRW